MVLITVPNTGSVRTSLVEKLIEFNKREDVELFFNSAKPVDVNRCEIANHFLEETDHDTLLMIDSDIIPPDNILDLLDYEFDIMTPVVFSTKEGVPYPVGAVQKDDGKLSMFTGNSDEEVVELDGVGTACMFVRREVFEGVEKPYFEFETNEDGTLNVSEDFSFCLKARDKGFSVKMHTGYSCGHVASMNLEKVMSNFNLALEANKSNMYVDEVGGENRNEDSEE